MANLFNRGKGPGGPTSLQKLLNLPDPLLTFKWICTSLPFNHPVEYVESIDLPFRNISIGDKTHGAAGYTYFPGTHDTSSFNMNFYEDSSASSLKFILAWKAAVKDLDTGLYNLPGIAGADNLGFKKTIKVQLLDAGNNPVVEVAMLGCWPADTGNLALNYTDTTGRLVITQTFSVDDQKVQFFF